jgi:predicted dehydrogenase
MKIGLLSFAHTHAASYTTLLRNMEGVELLTSDPGAVTESPDRPRGEAFAAVLGVDYAATYDELFAWKPDAVVITAENAHHRTLVELAASHGADILCEKPLATTVQDGEAMVAACRAAGVRLAVAYPVRFSRAYAGLREAVRSGALGDVVLVTGANNGSLPARAWFVDPDLAGAGAIIDHTVHIADLLDDLFDGTPAVQVYAQSNNLLYDGKFDVETAGFVTVTYANAVVATIDCSWSQPVNHPRWGGVEVQVTGSKALASMDAFGQLVGGWDTAAGRPFALSWGSNMDLDMLKSFLWGTSPTGVNVADGDAGLRSLRVATGALTSARTNQTVKIGYAD